MPTFTYKNTNINYSQSGKGSAIVLLHGFLENLEMWAEIIPYLSKRNKVVAIDLFGHGKSENFGYVHTVEEQAKMIRELLKSINIRKASLVGHSMGGYVALAFAELFPKNTKGICLQNSTSFADTEEKKKNRDRAIEAVKQNHKSFVRLSIPLLFSEDNRILLSKEVKLIVNDALNTSKQGIIASLEGMKIRDDRSEIFKNGAFKKMIILGENDTVLPLEIHKEQIKNSDINFVKIPHGHMSHVESFEELLDSLNSFINL